jgi:PEGA domain
MAVLDESGDPRSGRRPLAAALLAVVVVVAIAVGLWLVARRPAERPKGPPAPRARTSPRPTPRAPSPEAPAAHAPPEPRAGAAAPTLRVDADVPGSNVFLDRRFLGTTPVVTHDFAPGPHRLNVSAEGYDMYAETLDLTPSSNEVVVRFKEVRLDERVDVVHKHGVGSCRGRLVATTAGLRYEADKRADSFDLPFDKLEPLELDYMSRNLRVKQRGGRTWNFTADGADALLAFQKAVEKARKRLPAS